MFIIGYLLAMVISFIIAFYVKINLNLKIVILALIMAAFAFFVVPDINSRIDALPYLYSLDNLRYITKTNGLLEAWRVVSSADVTGGGGTSQVMAFGGAPLMGGLMILFSFLPNPVFLAVIAFADYFFVMKSIQLVVNRSKLDEQFFAYGYAIFMALLAFTNAVGGVRNNLVGTVFAYYCLRYFESQNRIWSFATLKMYVLIVVLSLIHPFTLLLGILFTLVIILKKRWQVGIVSILLVFQGPLQSIILLALRPLSFLPFVASILFKSNQYLGDTATMYISSRANWARDLARLVFVVALLVVLRKIMDQYVSHRYTCFVIFLILFAVGAIQDEVLFERCLLVLLPIIAPYLMLLLVSLKNVVTKQTNYLAGRYAFTMVFLLYATVCLVDNLRAGELYYSFLIGSAPLVTGF